MATTSLAAVGQFHAGHLTVRENREQILDLVAQAAARSARMLVLPETVDLGYFPILGADVPPDMLEQAIAVAEAPDGPFCRRVQAEATAHRMVIYCGMFLRRQGGGLDNAAVLFSPEQEPAVYVKTHLFRSQPYDESRFVPEGDRLVVAETPLGRVGLLICADAAFPEAARCLTLRGADLIAMGACWPLSAEHRWRTVVPARAAENQLYVLAAGQTRPDYCGESQIIDGTGRVLVRMDQESPGLVFAELDFAAQAEWRQRSPLLQHRRRELYTELIGLESGEVTPARSR